MEVIPLRAEPADGVDGIDVESATFLGARSGTRLFFRLVVRTDVVAPRATSREILLDVRFRADGAPVLGTQRLRFLVPGLDGAGCGASPTR